MAETAFQALYDQELIAGYERNQSILRETCTTRGIVKGNTFIFDIVDSGSASAVTRGVNGLIPERANNQTQQTLQSQRAAAAAQRLLEVFPWQAAQQVAEGGNTQTGQDFAPAPGYVDGCCGRLAKSLVIVFRKHRLHLPMAE